VYNEKNKAAKSKKKKDRIPSGGFNKNTITIPR
jgi:hypothetical protein